jgi:hypothetical protein
MVTMSTTAAQREERPLGPTTVEVSGHQSRPRSALIPLWFGLPPTAPSSGLEHHGRATPSAWAGQVFPP